MTNMLISQVLTLRSGLFPFNVDPVSRADKALMAKRIVIAAVGPYSTGIPGQPMMEINNQSGR